MPPAAEKSMRRMEEMMNGRFRLGRVARRLAALVAAAALTGGLAASGAHAQADTDRYGITPGSFFAKSHQTITESGTGPLITALAAESWLNTVGAKSEINDAGAHADASAGFQLNRYPDSWLPIRSVKDVIVDTPPGFAGNPQVVPPCTLEEFFAAIMSLCPKEAQVGLIGLGLGSPAGSALGTFSAIYRLSPTPPGYPALFGFKSGAGHGYLMYPSLNSERNYAVRVSVRQAPVTFRGEAVALSTVSMFGVPYSSVHNVHRYSPGNGDHVTGSWNNAVSGTVKPFLINPTHCESGELTTHIATRAWEEPERWVHDTAQAAEPDNCHLLKFGTNGAPVSLAARFTSREVDSPSGLSVKLRLPYNDDPNGLARPTLRDAVMELPDGVTVNSAAGDGLEGCSPGEIGLKSDSPVRCPAGSKLGTVRVKTPLLEEELMGALYQALPFDNPFDSLLAVYLVVDHADRGILVKLPGEVRADRSSGKLTATFRDNPQLPFTEMDLDVKSGPRAPLAAPRLCGPEESRMTLTPWSHPQSGPPAVRVDGFDAVAGAGEACPSGLAGRPLPVGFDGGMVSPAASSFSPFVMRLTRPDGAQELERVDVTPPEGLLASVRDVPYCSEAGVAQAFARERAEQGRVEQADPSCPEVSRVGRVVAGAGAGSSPLFVDGKVYLAGEYKDAPLSLVFVVPAVAGPFDLGVQTVRVALNVDRRTAQVRAESDVIPKIMEGIPLRIRDVRVNMDRPGFTLNPSSCEETRVDGLIVGSHGARSDVSDRFQVGDCAVLPFKPRLSMRLTGKKQVRTGKHPGIRAQVTQLGVGEAGIEKARVTLPKSLALDVNNAQALCEFEDGTKPDLENHCPKGSIVGRAVAQTPLLKRPLEGNVYFVKNVRRDPKTGNAIRTLPMIIAALRGEVAINLVGESDTTKAGRLVNTFAQVPDAPVSRFNLNINGGSNGIIAVTRTRRAKINLCAQPKSHVAEADMDGQNGKRYDRNIRMATPCSKRQVKKAKRAQARKRNR